MSPTWRYLLSLVSFHLHHWNPRYIQPQEQPQPQGELNHQRTFIFFRRSLCIVRYEILPTFSLFLHPFQIPRMWISMWFYHCEASIVAFLCFQIGKGKYRSQCRPQKILGKNEGMGFWVVGKKNGVVFFSFGESVRFWVWMCICLQVEHWQKWRIRSYVCISWSFRDFLLSICM